MQLWNNSGAAADWREPRAGQPVTIEACTSPVEPGQSVRVVYRVGDGKPETRSATWVRNRDSVSYWSAALGPFSKGDQVEYWLEGTSEAGASTAAGSAFEVAPRLWLSLLWHQHQPLYRDLSKSDARGAYLRPWVRLHAIRDYYAMAALAGEVPGLQLTINLTPVLIEQLDEYANDGASDRALELTLKPAGTLSMSEREELLRTFFDADWHNQIFVHARYRELFAQRTARQPFADQDIRDLQMWFNLSWFGKELRESEVSLVTGDVASVQRFVRQGHGFSDADISEMVGEQLKVMRAVVPLHRKLQDAGTIEVATTPHYHPILPLLVDTDRATIDRPGTTFPRRFHHPEDAEAQVASAVELYRKHFGVAPRGMWPAEGAVASFVLPIFARHGVVWIASDQGVLARSGEWGYRVDKPEVLCRVYRSDTSPSPLLFFRATGPSDDIGFHFQGAADYATTARDFVRGLKERYAAEPEGDDRLLTIALDGENAWGSYREDGRPFLRALYQELTDDPEIQTTTFSSYIERRAKRAAEEATVHHLFTGSWIDELGSAPGVDLGTWIGEQEENRAWELLGQVRDTLGRIQAPDLPAGAVRALQAAEGSDWFWWFGDDQDSGSDQDFDDLFRAHLRSALQLAGKPPLGELEQHIVPHSVVWTFSAQVEALGPEDRLVVRTHCPGTLDWWSAVGDGSAELSPVGGVMAGLSRYEKAIGPFGPSRDVTFRFRCQHVGCSGHEPCCAAGTQKVRIQ